VESRPIKVFVSYSHRDDAYLRRDSLLGFLSGLRHTGIELWTDRTIPPGAQWDEVIRSALDSADIVLLLVSQAFLDSDYVRNVELRVLLERRIREHLLTVPVLLSPCAWQDHEWLSALQFFPPGDRTVEEDFPDEGARKRLYSQLRRALKDEAQTIRDREQGSSTRSIAERRRVAVARCELRIAAGEDLDPDEESEIIYRATEPFERCAVELATRFDGHLVEAPPEAIFHFGYPSAHEDDAYRAIACALELARRVEELPSDEDFGVGFRVRAGIDYGLVVVDDEGRLTGKPMEESDRLRLLSDAGVLVSGGALELVDGQLNAEEVAGGAGYRVTYTPPSERQMSRSTPFLGREAELALLHREWRRAREGRGGIVLVGGERGAGKSRLLVEFKSALASESFRYVELLGSPLFANNALHPVIERVRKLVEVTGADSGLTRSETFTALLVADGLEERTAVPALMPLLEAPEDFEQASAQRSAAAAREDLLEALCSWILAISDREPVLITLDNAGWADPTTVELFTALLDYIQDSPVLIVALSSKGFPSEWRTARNATEVRLDRFTAETTAALIQALDTEGLIPRRAVPEILRATDGIPLYVEEYVGMLLEREPTATSSELAGASDVPSTLRGLLAQRLDVLGAAKPSAQLAAVIGTEFDESVFLAVARLSELACPEENLEQMLQADVLQRQGRPGRRRYAFRHGLLRDAAYDTLLSRARRKYHRLIASYLQEHSSEGVDAEPAILAVHLERSGQKASALACWHRFACAAAARSSIREANHGFEHAVALLPALPEAERAGAELRLRLDHGAVLIALKGYGSPEMAQTYERARDLCRQVGEQNQLFPALWGAWSYYIVRADLDTAADLARQIDEVAGGGDDIPYRIEADHVGAVTCFNLGRFEEALARLDHGLALCKEHGTPDHVSAYGQDVEVALRCWRALTLTYLGHRETAREALEQARERARQIGHVLSEVFVGTFLGIVREAQCGYAIARDESWLASQKAEESGFVFWRAWCEFNGASAAWALDHDRRDLVRLQEAVRTYTSTGARVWAPLMELRLAMCLAEAGEAPAALRAAESGMAALGEDRERYYCADALRYRAAVSALSGDPDTAHALLREAWSVAWRQHHRSAALRIASAAVELDAPDARSEGLQWLGELGADPALEQMPELKDAVLRASQ